MRYLSVGDVVFLGTGEMVYGQIPEKFVYSNRLFSSKLVNHDIKIGRIYDEASTNPDDVINEIAKKVLNAFESNGAKISMITALQFVGKHAPIRPAEKFVLDSGEFVVIKTLSDGGSHGGHDDYPDGHHVYCKKLKDDAFDPDGLEVNFYQSGCFTAMIKDIKPIRKMTQTPIAPISFS